MSMLGDRSPGVGMSEAYLVAEDRHPRHIIRSTLYLKADTTCSHLTISFSMVIVSA